jgi:F-type H+-transporting ATPase subunit delta
MRRGGVLARRYAKALFQIGKERGILEKLHEDMTAFVRGLQENREFYHFFISPEVPRKEKEEKIEEIFGDAFSNVFYNFLLVVLKKRRQDLILDIAEEFNGELDRYNNRVKAHVTTAVALPPRLQEEIRSRLADQLKKEVILIPHVDPQVLGGIRITVDGLVIDGSLRGKLEKMRRFLLERAGEALN